MTARAGLLVGAMLAGLAITSQANADLVVGLPADTGTGNCFPFGCAANGEYQQVYTSGSFSGPITITNLEFYNTSFDSGVSNMNSGSWTISLSTTAADWNSLSANFASNIGANNTTVFTGNLFQPWVFGDTLHIILNTPFTYDPAGGNLLMDVVVSGASDPFGAIYFDTNGFNGGGFNGNTIMGRVYDGNTVNSGYGLVTGFTTGIPEPASLALFGFGITGLALIRRHASSGGHARGRGSRPAS